MARATREIVIQVKCVDEGYEPVIDALAPVHFEEDEIVNVLTRIALAPEEIEEGAAKPEQAREIVNACLRRLGEPPRFQPKGRA